MTTRPDDTPPNEPAPAADPASPPRPAAPTSLAALERRAVSRRGRPAYGHDALIACDRLVRVFTTDGVEVQALQGLDLLVAEGELMALVGASGSGKSRPVAIRDGRTSSEVLRRTERDAATGQESLVSREYAMLDRAGRLQLPTEYTTGLGMAHRVLLERESDHIGGWPDHTADGAARGRDEDEEGSAG
ncbi:hypothetical protein Srufu_051550 [Streptomyces libani subsp. rufus]|nr:hypothetical protein Srufu_051550 [Streptomyces libani subsp. rufus]